MASTETMGMKTNAPRAGKHSTELKISIARQVLEAHVKQEELSRRTGISRTNIHKWVAQARRGELFGYQATTVEKKSGDLAAEVRRLERELNEVRMERDFLKKAAAFFARGSR